MRHPGELELALYGGGDLVGWQRWRIACHAARCQSCAELAARYRLDRRQIAAAGRQLPAGLDWGRLADEMQANIHVALAAGDCVARPARPRGRLSWRGALAIASMTAVVLAGWWLYVPRSTFAPPAPRIEQAQQDVVLETTRFGIERKTNGATLALSHPSDERTVLTANTDGVLRARYVDDASGQVTINNVYAQ